MSPVLEPVADLSGREARLLGQLPLLPWGRVRVLGVPLAENDARLLLEAVTSLLAVPDRTRQREFTPYAIFPDGSERLSAQAFGLNVVRLQPQLLHLGVRLGREVVALEHAVEIGEVALVEGDQRAGLHDALVLLDLLTGGETPEEPRQSIDVSALLQYVAYARNLLRRESVRTVRDHPG